MSVPLRQQFDVALYIIKQKMKGNKHYPLVLMLEPLFRCNLACAGCGKIDYPDEILNQRRRRMRRADRLDPRRRTAAAQGNRPDRQRPDRAQKIRHALHQRAADGKEDGFIHAIALLQFLGASRRRPAGS